MEALTAEKGAHNYSFLTILLLEILPNLKFLKFINPYGVHNLNHFLYPLGYNEDNELQTLIQ